MQRITTYHIDFHPRAILLIGAAVVLFLSSLLTALMVQPSNAMSTSGFKAGDIMSDGVMSNAATMSESQIESFLKRKNSCTKTLADANGQVIADSSTKAHWKGISSITYQITGGVKGSSTKGSFRCLADSKFGGETAPHIIYKAARYYHVNPQVLIVLLQKEQGLVTDVWPNSNQFAAATGYACPDHGQGCDPDDAGFKSQVRGAALMFDEVLTNKDLDGDHFITNYPVGTNTVYYNPGPCKTTDGNGKCTVWYGRYGDKRDITYCGSSKVDIKNRATSALYRYTPYQPNSATLKAGWPSPGNIHCGAYGNLNFYMYFTVWFGNTHYVFHAMQKPRYLSMAKDLYKIYPNTGNKDSQLLEKGRTLYFTSVVNIDGDQYLRTKYDTDHSILRGIARDDLKEFTFTAMKTPRYMTLNKKQNKLYPIENRSDDQLLAKGEEVYFSEAITVNGTKYLRSRWDAAHGLERAVPLDELSELVFKPMQAPRYMTSTKEQNKISPITREVDSQVIADSQSVFFNQVLNINGVQYLRSEWDADHDLLRAMPRDDLEELEFKPMSKPRYIKSAIEQTKIFPVTKTSDDQVIAKGESVFFSESMLINGVQYLRSRWDADHDLLRAIPRSSLAELQYSALDSPKYMRLTRDQYKINPITHQRDSQLLNKDLEVYFSQILDINGKQYLRSNWDEVHNINRAVPLTSLAEITS